MTNLEIILLGLSIAFCWVEYLNPFKFKPFNCTKCMTGWFSLLIATIIFRNIMALAFLPAGVFAGAMFEGIKMKWL